MQAARLATRLQRELRMLQTDPPPGVCAWPCRDSLTHMDAQIRGPDDTVYMKGIFLLEVRVPERYPFEPPNVKFRTPIYHPNIDSGGRICLDILNMPPKGAWKPSLNIPTILASIGLLLAEPNQDDGLMEDITREYKHDRAAFDAKARKWTEKFAVQNRWNDVGQKGPETPPPVDRELLASEPSRAPEGPEGRVQDSLACESEKQASSLKLSNGQRSVNQKSKLSMKLCRGKDVTVSDKEEQPMAGPVPNDASRPDTCVDRRNSNLRIHRQPEESSSRPSSIGMGPRKSSVDERAKPSGASTSTADAAAMEGNAARGRGADPSLSSGIKDADASKEIPHPSDRIASHSARKRPRESEKLTNVSEQTPTDTKVVSPRAEEIAAPQSPPPIPQSNTAGDYGGHLGVASSKLSTHRFGPGRLKAESFSLQSSKRTRQHTDAASASCSLAAEPSVFHCIVPDTEEQTDADKTAKSPGQSRFNFKRPSLADEHREEHTLPAHASERSRDVTGKGSSKPAGNQMGDRPAGKLSTSAGIPNRDIESSDEDVQNRCKNPGKAPRMKPEDALEIRPRAEASSKMAEMISQRASGTGRESHPCVPSIPVSNCNSREVAPVPAPVIESSKTTIPENTKELKGVEDRSEPTKRAADVIVLDSESEEEPPKVVSRLSLARRKGLKRK